MQAGKDVYCEKPLTLTIDEGKQIVKVLKQTGRVFQVGTQQRSEMALRFLKAVAMVKDGRLGNVRRVQCAIGSVEPSGVIPKAEVPSHLNWDMWLGQAPLTDYRYKPNPNKRSRYGFSRCHYEFRWWYEYSGGKMTDWGAHHVDIGQWAIGMEESGPVSISGTASHPVEMKNGNPTDDSQYNVATSFNVVCRFANGVEMVIRDDTENGITIEGDKSSLFVSRGALRGPAVDELAQRPLPEDAIKKLYKNREPGDHMRNFFECVKSREQPISDVFTHHRAMTTCHLANIAIRLGRAIKWNPTTQQIEGDPEAAAMQRREQRKGYEINV
jgi:predicted dehydrogenase